MIRFPVRRIAAFAVAVVAFLALATAATGAPLARWRVVAKASDSGEYFVSASMYTSVKGALAASLAVNASGRAEITGSVSCFKGFDYERRSFAFALRSGSRYVPLPLRNADCSYQISASRDNGRVAIALYIWK